MNIVVTGATSFLGAAAAGRLLELGHQVYAVVRPRSANRGVLRDAPGLHVIELELEELHRIDRYIQVPCERFVHFGWDGSGSGNRMKAGVQRKNVEDSLKALEGAGRLGCRRFLFSGSQAEYGIVQTAMTEDLPCHPVSEYGKAKLEFYRQAKSRIQQEEGLAGMEYIQARIFSVYGPGDHPWSLVHTCLDTFSKGGGMELGTCTQQWNYLYIDDCVEGILSLLFCEDLMENCGIYNIAGGETATVPLSAYVEEMYRLCGNRGTYSYGTVAPNAEGPANLIPDIHKVTRVTGWEPKISFKEGIKRMLEIEHCLACERKLPKLPLITLSGMPASAQDIPDKSQVDSERGMTLQLFRCEHCGLVQFDCQPVDYYRDVIRSGGFTTTMVELRRNQYRHLIETYHLEGKKFIEVGCGRGEFLSVLQEFPVESFGVEHKKDLAQLARAQGLTVWEGFAESEDTVLGEDGPYDVFLSFNFLEHQPDPGAMLDCIDRNLSPGGMGLLTVPSLEYILHYNGYYELIRDHIAYYDFRTLRYLLNLHGFEVLEEEMVNRDTCSVIVRKTEKTEPVPEVSPIDVSGLLKSREAIGREVNELTEALEREGKTLAVWGASHQGFTLAATTGIGTAAKYIIDSAPFKQGRYAPASHVPIVAPEHYMEEPVDVILIVAPGYTDEIAGVIRQRYGSQVKILVLKSSHLEEWEDTL